MPHTSPSESAYLLDAKLIEKAPVRGLRSLLGALLILQMLMAGVLTVTLVFGVSVVHSSAHLQLGVVAAAIIFTGLTYRLLLRGQHVLASHVLVFSMVACSAASIIAYGSARSAMVMGFAGAVVVAGMMLDKKALVMAVLLSAATLALLVWAEASGRLGRPDFGVDLVFWLVHVMLLAGIAACVYTSRQVVLRALRDQHTDLQRRQQAEDQLRLSEDRFSRIFRSSPAAIVVQSLEGGAVLDVNPAFERLYGYTREEFIGQTDAVLWDKAEARQSFRKLIAGVGRRVSLPQDGRTKDGQLIHVMVSTEIEGMGHGRIVVSTITDATAEHQARQAARQSAELFSKAFDFSPINMTITRVSDGTFLAVNAAEDAVQGFDPGELIGRTSVEVGVWRNNQERLQFVEELRTTRQLSRQMQMRHKSGRMIDCQMWSVMIEIANQPCILSSTINISEQKRHEALLIDMARGLSSETGEAFFRSVVQHLGQAIGADLVMIGETGPDDSVSSLAMMQGGVHQPNISYSLAGTPCDMAIGANDLCVYGDGIQQLFPQDHILVDGGYHAYAGAALRDADGSAIGIVNALWHAPQAASADRDALMKIFASRTTAELVRLRRDREIQRLHDTLEQRVTERTDQLMATNAELESFGYSVSHDLQSPLRSIEGFSVLLARRLKGRLSEEEERLFDRVRINVVRMHELINDLLALARASKGKLVLAQIDLSALAEQVVAQLRQREPRRQVKVEVQSGLNVRCDSKFARIILENLLGNAWKYSRDKTDAVISFGALPTREGGRKMLFVRDNGAGFDMAYADSLFKPFHRLHHDTEFEGSGIGLATVHRILERHGGTIRGESAEGAGACFYFSFDPRFGAARG
jgi:PAS domain S-box-containing protein